MGNQNTKTELSKFLKVVFQKLWQWEQEVERSKKAKTHYIATIGWKGMAAILQYSATVKIARLGAELLGRSMENRKARLAHLG